MMRLLYLTDLLSPYRIEWINEITKVYDVTTYYFDDSEKTRDKGWLQSKTAMFKCYHAPSKNKFGIKFSPKMLDILNTSDFDICIIDGYSSAIQVQAITTLTKQNKNVFVNIDGIDIWRKKRASDFLLTAIKKRVFSSGAKFLCGSQIAVNKAIKLGAKSENVFHHDFTSLHASDFVDFETKNKWKDIYKSELCINARKVAVAVGRFIPLKRYDVLLKAWTGAPDDAALYIIGGGQEYDTYQAIISKNNIKNVHLLDFMSYEKLKKYYIAGDVFIHPSNTETWGLVLNEAMSCGLPVIATDHCVAAIELIRDDWNGYVVPVDDEKVLKNSILRILNNDELANNMSKNSISTIKNYTIENMAKTHMQIFDKVINSEDNG